MRQDIRGNVIKGVVTDQDGEQEELFCRVCDTFEKEIEDGAEEEMEVQKEPLG